MTTSDAKRMIVVRGIASNLVEEAILILKKDLPAQAEEGSKNSCNSESSTNALILKEAQEIVKNYEKTYKRKIWRKHFVNRLLKNAGPLALITLLGFAAMAFFVAEKLF